MSDDNTPVVRVVSGSPTPEELAAILTVLAGLAEEPGPADERNARPRVGGWKSYTRTMRRSTPPGPGAWQFAAH